MKMLLCFFMLLIFGLDVSLSQGNKDIRKLSKQMEKLEETNEEFNSKLDNLVEQTNMTQAKFESTNLELETFKNESQAQLDAANMKFESFKYESQSNVNFLNGKINNVKNNVETQLEAKFEATNMELETFKNESQAQLDAANIKFESFKNESETNVKSLGENITNQHEELNSKLDNLVEQTNMTQAKFEATNMELKTFKNESQVIQSKLESIDSKLKLIVENHECYEYNTLSEADRGISNEAGSKKCDKTGSAAISPMWKGASWYRFLPPAGTILSLSAPGAYHCGTNVAGWTNGTLPTVPGSTLDIKICFDYSPNQCYWNSAGRVTNCGTYFVYYLDNTPGCHGRYCGAN